MKYFIALLCVVVAVLTIVQADDDHDEKFKHAEETCMKKTGQKAEVLADARKGKFADGDNMGCYAECVFNEVGFMKDGKLNHEVIHAAAKNQGGADGEKHAEIAHKCLEKSGKDTCDTAHQIFKCYWEAVNA